MTLHVLPVWNDATGADTGPLSLPPARTQEGVQSLIQRAFAMARRARGTNVRALVVCDLTWRTVATVKPKRSVA